VNVKIRTFVWNGKAVLGRKESAKRKPRRVLTWVLKNVMTEMGELWTVYGKMENVSKRAVVPPTLRRGPARDEKIGLKARTRIPSANGWAVHARLRLSRDA